MKKIILFILMFVFIAFAIAVASIDFTLSCSNGEPPSIVIDGTVISLSCPESPLPPEPTPPSSPLENLADNTALNLGVFTCTNPSQPGANCQKVTDFSGMVYDQNNYQILMFGGGHATTMTDTVFVFNFDTLEWTEEYPPTPCSSMSASVYDKAIGAWTAGPAGPYPRPISRHTAGSLIFTPNTNELIVTNGAGGTSNSCPILDENGDNYSTYTRGKIAHYDLNAKTWSFSQADTFTGRNPYYSSHGSEYDPVSGKVVMLGTLALEIYDPITREKHRAIDGGRGTAWYSWGKGMVDGGNLVYYPPNDRMYYFAMDSDEVWEVILDRNDFSKTVITKLDITGNYPVGPTGGGWPANSRKSPAYAYDSVNEIIGGRITDNVFYAFDPKTYIWTSHIIQGGSPGSKTFYALEYDPVNNVFIFLTENRETWVYRYRNNPPDADLIVTNSGSVYPLEQVDFYADYRVHDTNALIEGATCTIVFDDGVFPMVESGNYSFGRVFNLNAVEHYTINCSKTGHDTLNYTDAFVVKAVPINDGIIRVGPTRVLKTVRKAAAIVKDNDTVEIDAYLYPGDVATWYANNITIRGVGGRPHLRADGANEGGKGIWVIKGNSYTIINIEFSGAIVSAGNGAGIRSEGDNLTIRYSYFHDNQNGIMGSLGANGTILVEYSEFNHNWRQGGNNHNIYIGREDKFILRYSYVHHSTGGHNIKSRAKENHILYNRIMDEEDGDSSMAIDISEGGLAYVIGNIIQQGENTKNYSFLGYGFESMNHPINEIYISGNTLVNDNDKGIFFQIKDGATAKIVNNLLVGPGTVLQGPGELTNNIQTDDPGFIDRDNFDYRLLSSSIAIDGGVDPGSAYEYDLTPKFHYVHPAGKEARNIIGNIDVGAYEYLSEGNVLLPPVNLYIKEN